jgi:hypothetical protein
LLRVLGLEFVAHQSRPRAEPPLARATFKTDLRLIARYGRAHIAASAVALDKRFLGSHHGPQVIVAAASPHAQTIAAHIM